MKSILQVFKVNDVKEGNAKVSGKPYRMQDAECALLTDDGTVDQVGVLMLPKALVDKVAPGVFLGSFALRANMASRRIEAVLTDLQPYSDKQPAPAGSK